MRVTPLFGAGVAGKSLPLTSQRRLNVYLENRPDGDKTKVAFIGTPGLVLKSTLAAPARGLLGVTNNFYAVAGNNLYSWNGIAWVAYSANLSTNVGNVTFAASPNQIMIVDGDNGYILKDGTLINLSFTGFPNGAKTCTFVGGYFVVEQPGTQQFYVSNSYDGTTWNALAFASASQYPDTLVAVDSLNGNLLLFSQLHTEFWQNVGSTPEPFAPILPATTELGLAAIWSRAHVGNNICFLAQNPQGSVQIAMASGYQITIISNPDIDYIMSTFSMVSDAVAMSYQVDNHSMYQITFPTANRTFLFDLTTGVWSEMQTGISTGYAQRHIGNFAAQYAGQTMVSDYCNGNIYCFSPAAYTDNGATILRQLITKHVSQSFNGFCIDELYFDMETGVGLESGQGSNPTIMISCSKDNGRTYSTDRYMNLGTTGTYLDRVITRQWGSARDFVFKIQMTDPVKFVLNDGAITMREKPQ